MITAQDIREKTFEQAKFGGKGYDMNAVDDFLEELADEITAAQKENSVLKSKMKVLVDKIEEYRANEEALNLAVLSAQKLAVQIEADARARSAAMIADAERQVKAQLGSITEQTEAEERRLADAKEATAKFFKQARSAVKAHLANLDSISKGIVPQAPAAPAAPAKPAPAPAAVEEAVRSIESSVANAQPEAPVDLDLDLSTDFDAPVKPRDNTQTFSL